MGDARSLLETAVLKSLRRMALMVTLIVIAAVSFTIVYLITMVHADLSMGAR